MKERETEGENKYFSLEKPMACFDRGPWHGSLVGWVKSDSPQVYLRLLETYVFY